MRVVDAEAKKPEGAENESVEQLSAAGRTILNKCELLLSGGLQTEITNGEKEVRNGTCTRRTILGPNSTTEISFFDS